MQPHGFEIVEIAIALRKFLNFFRRFIPKDWRHYFPSVGRFVPGSSNYPASDEYQVTRDGVKFLLNRSDYVQWRIFYGVRDNALHNSKNCLCNNHIVLDIGTNVGAFSLKLAKYVVDTNIGNISIHCFEPNPVVFGVLQNNLLLNPELRPIVQLYNYGLGNDNIEKSFQYNNSNTGAGRIVASGDSKIKVRRLDDFIGEINPIGISFIKLIVEGFEPEVLKGGWRTIQKFKPPIFLEVTPEWWSENGADTSEVLNSLESIGYQFMIERHNELRAFKKARDLSSFQFNLFAIPRP